MILFLRTVFCLYAQYSASTHSVLPLQISDQTSHLDGMFWSSYMVKFLDLKQQGYFA
jgi:hypothetical protein